MEIKNKVLRDIYATGIKKPYINLSKAKFNKIFDYKLKKRVTNPGGATVTNKKKKTDYIKDILKIFLELSNNDIIVNQKFENTKRQPDYLIKKYKLIFEYDGPDHYRNPFKIYSDRRKFKEYQNYGYRVVRWPYYMQLSKDVAEYIFGDLIKHFRHDLKKLPKKGFYRNEKFFKAIGKVYRNVFTGKPAKSENEILAHGLHGSNEVASSMTNFGIDNLLNDFAWRSKKSDRLKTPKSIMYEFMYSHKLYIDDISDVENLKYTDLDKKKLILPTAHKEFMNLYNKVMNEINFDDLKGLFPRSKNSILKTISK